MEKLFIVLFLLFPLALLAQRGLYLVLVRYG